MPLNAMPRGHCPLAVGTSLCGSSWRPLAIVVWPPLFCPLQAIEKLVALLNTLDRWIDETPPVDQPSRFGNKAYRTWYAKLDEVRLPRDMLGGWARCVGDFGHLKITGEFVKQQFHLPKIRTHLPCTPAVFWESLPWRPIPQHSAVNQVRVCISNRFQCPRCLCAGHQLNKLVDPPWSTTQL